MSKFEGTVDDIVFRNNENGWTVASVQIDGSGRISAVGVLPFLAAGEHVILDGEITEHRTYGRQIKVSAYQSVRPETKSAVEKYLESGLIKGIGKSTAKAIVKRFGAKALDILESEPERLTEIPGIGKKRLKMIAESYAEQNGMRNTLLFLQGYGISPSLSMRIYRVYGDMTEQVLRANPYRLVNEIEGVGFRTADRIAESLGFGKDSDFRLNSGLQYVLSEAMNGRGDVYLPRPQLLKDASAILGAPAELLAHRLDEQILTRALVSEQVEDKQAVYLPAAWRAECDAAQLLADLIRRVSRPKFSEAQVLKQIERYERDCEVELCAEQRQAVLAAVQKGVAVVTGGPGTGKTTSINCIIRVMSGMGQVELCAPTGRAAKRMSEATGCPARTIHRLLEYSGEDGFTRNADNPVEADAVIVDEVSMVDIFLFGALLRALRPGTRLILVGDADQLPSVGAGNVLKDLIASGAVPVVRLNQIFRQAQKSMIVVNAHRINRGEYPSLRAKDTDFFIERKEHFDDAADAVVALVQKRLPGYLGVDPLRGIQVMAPMKKGDLGVFALNARLQAALNPPGRDKPEVHRGDTVFRLGDKVMQIRNDYDIEWESDDRHGTGVFNGDIGYIVGASAPDAELEVEFDEGRRAVYDAGMLDELEPAYCMSVHKSQGSEFDAVVLPLMGGPPMLMTRNLLYTAVTRARRLVIVVGRQSCVEQMVDNNRILQRCSGLGVRLAKACGI